MHYLHYLCFHLHLTRTLNLSIAKLLQAPDTAATARQHVDSIDEEFFMVSSTYLDMASVLYYIVPAASASTIAAKPVSVCATTGSQGG